MKKFKDCFFAVMPLFFLLVFAGCASMDEDLTASDISVETLEARMAAKVDPEGAYTLMTITIAPPMR